MKQDPLADKSWLDHVNPHVRIVGKSSGQKNYIDPRRVIYDHELMLFGSGGEFALDFDDGAHVRFESNSFVIIPPARWHICRGVICEHVERAWIHFDWSFDNRPVADLDMTYAPAAPVPALYHHAPAFVPQELMHGHIENPAAVFALHHRISERFNFASGSRQKSSRALLLELLLELLGADEGVPLLRKVERVQSPFTPFAIRDALDEYAMEPFNTCPPIREFLAVRGQSYDHQARVFKKSFAVSPLQYVNSLRVEHACNLLRDTQLKIGEVAAQLGYDDLVYFGRIFKKVTKQTAQDYRRAQQ